MGDPVFPGVPYTENGLLEEELINWLSDSGEFSYQRFITMPEMQLISHQN